MIQLRWVVPDKTTTNPPVLQYRTRVGPADGYMWDQWSEWAAVPRVVLPVDSSGEFLDPSAEAKP